MEAILALVGEDVDRAVGLHRDRNFLLALSVLHQDYTAEDDETILGRVLVKLQFFT